MSVATGYFAVLLRRRSVCRHCRKPVVWLTRDDLKTLPFEPTFRILRTEAHPKYHTQVNVIAYSDVHDCPERRAATRNLPQRRRQESPAGGLF